MKYIKLFEAFESNTISKVMKFINSKIGKSEFRKSLISVLRTYDIPIDKIKDSDVDYLNRAKALNVKNDNKVNNKFGIYCLKFWFSIDEGYIGYTAVGNDTFNYENWKNRNKRSSGDNKKFDTRALDYIMDELDITTGEISVAKVDDYSNFKTGDKVIGVFNEYYEMSRITLATIWVDNYGQIYAIQGESSGGSPDRDTQEVNGERVSWRDFGRYSWNMGTLNSPADDHCYLHTYKESDKPLHYKQSEILEDDKEKINVLDFNLPVGRGGSIENWSNSRSISSPEEIDKADFGVIFYLDNMLDPDKSEFYETPTDIKKQRSEDRKGATKLLSDSQIKDTNIARYMSKLISKMGIEKDVTELKDLQKVVLKNLCGEFAFIALYSNRPRLSNITTFSNHIRDLILTKSDGDKEYYIERAIEVFQTINTESSNYYKKYSDSKKEIIKNDYHIDIFNKIYEIGNYIYEYFRNIEINTLEDLRMVIFKMTSIINLHNDSNFRIHDRITNIMSEFYDKGDVTYYCDKGRLSDDEEKESMKRLGHIERYIKSILK
jgi:hypothetical protein